METATDSENFTVTETQKISTILPGTKNDDEDDNSTVIVAVVIGIVVVIVVAIGLAIWLYRRKTGSWPKPFCRDNAPRFQRNPYGSKCYAARWQKGPGLAANFEIATHRMDFREPSPVEEKNVSTITEKISNHLYKASQKATREGEKKKRTSINKMSHSYSQDCVVINSNKDEAQRSLRRKSIPLCGDEIGVYHDRTLPATLMMTSESKMQKFANEEKALKRSNSATLRSSSGGRSSGSLNNPNPESHDSIHMQAYNDFGTNYNVGKFSNRRKARASYLSSKPSNTSDYVSDADASVDGRKWKKRERSTQLRGSNPKKRISDCDSMLQDSSIPDKHVIEDVYERELEEALQADSSSLTVFSAGFSQDEVMSKLRTQIQKKKKIHRLFDDRTESQQNTMKSDTFSGYSQKISEEESSTVEGQSSDTESMTELGCETRGGGSFKTKKRRYDSDGGFQGQQAGSKRVKSKVKRKCRRARSDGWESEPGLDTRKKTRNRNISRTRSRLHPRGEENLAFQKSPSVTYSKNLVTVINNKSNNNVNRPIGNCQKPDRGKSSKVNNLSYQSSSLKVPISGTLFEVPIYSQTTWSGPSTTKKKPSKRRPPRHKEHSQSVIGYWPGSPRKSKKNASPGRTLSIGGGGRYFCEYDSLPVDLSKLPKDLVAKIGGQAEQLLEPIDQLNFDQLCRPLPSLGKTDGELSARRLMAEKLRLPPDHRDREVLSNTYEYEDTGLVMTDL